MKHSKLHIIALERAADSIAVDVDLSTGHLPDAYDILYPNSLDVLREFLDDFAWEFISL